MPKPAVSPAPAGFASLIVADFPALFAEGKRKKFGRDKPPGFFAEFHGEFFTLLWRGSCDGFRAKDFHGRCDGHANTLTFIEDTAGNIFGGFAPVEWESRKYDAKASEAFGRHNCVKADPSLKSFLFTLKNPHNFPATKFALKAEEKHRAIVCRSDRGPHFRDICGSGNCNANTDSFPHGFGRAYANDTGQDPWTFFSASQGSGLFTVKEIEVFEMTA
jgi:hypothetical protein